jgi:hypothetical protein
MKDGSRTISQLDISNTIFPFIPNVRFRRPADLRVTPAAAREALIELVIGTVLDRSPEKFESNPKALFDVGQ